MKVKAKIVARYENEGKLKAVATVCLDGEFLVTGVRVVEWHLVNTAISASQSHRNYTTRLRTACLPPMHSRGRECRQNRQRDSKACVRKKVVVWKLFS